MSTLQRPIARRRLLGGAALAGGALALPACAANVVARRPSGAASAGCLAPVDVSPGRVIRTVAGLRPFRRSGFVVRAEQSGDTRIVHNYGHGGAGITLGWGTSRLAADLGLPGHSGPVAVIGAGIAGLTTALLIQEAGFPVTLYAAALPPETTSNVAGGQFDPYGHFDDDAVTAQWRAQFLAATDYSWRRYQLFVGEDYGVRWLPTFAETSSGRPRRQILPTYPPVNRVLRPDEHPFAGRTIVRYDTLYVETGRFLRRLLADFRLNGGRVVLRSFAAPHEIAALPEKLAFNCTGLGARDLFRDTELEPVRGQLAILLPQPEVRYAFTGTAGYMFPRPDGIVLGGTFERGEWSTQPEPAAIERILASHRRLFAGLGCTA